MKEKEEEREMYHFTKEELRELCILAYNIQEEAGTLRFHAATELRLRDSSTGLVTSTHNVGSIEEDVLCSLLRLRDTVEGILNEYR